MCSNPYHRQTLLSLGIYQGMIQLGHMVVLFLVLRTLFFFIYIADALIYNLTSGGEGSFPAFTDIDCVLYSWWQPFWSQCSVQIESQHSLIYIFLMANDIDLFIYLLTICISYFEKCLKFIFPFIDWAIFGRLIEVFSF